MSHYGKLLDPTYDPRKDSIYKLFVTYFGNLSMTKIKNVDRYSMYAAKIRSGLSTEHRYIFIFIDNDNLPIGNMDSLNIFRWLSLQTRTISDNHDIPPQTYNPRRFPDFMDIINLTNKSKHKYEYSAEKLPLNITLLSSKEGTSEYRPRGSVVTAIETYNTVINFKN
jgi:hypothetical protein